MAPIVAPGSNLAWGWMMHINANFSQRAVVQAKEHSWVPSPQQGVERVMLDRLGGEKARATSLVRYAPASWFPAHEHPGGEEILVLSGMFSDDCGHYGPGWYLRNPPGSVHQPFSAEGALIFVKLWQAQADDKRTVRVDTSNATLWRREGACEVCLLHQHGHELVRLLRLPPLFELHPETHRGAECLVISGQLIAGPTILDSLSWLRLPPGEATVLRAGATGTTIYLKTGHLTGSAA